MKLLITGVAGFVGFHLASALAGYSHFELMGLDNLNDYYDPQLKKDRLSELEARGVTLAFTQLDLADREGVAAYFEQEKPDMVVHLAAQAGVRYSLQNPYAYADSNLLGFMHILEGCRQHKVRHLIYASSSSVYGLSPDMPYSMDQRVDNPVSLYAATKKANELMAHSYAHLYKIPMTGLRFFTVYGPWGRPDMAYFSFTKAMLAGEVIKLFNHGDMRRDFTYIDDIVEGLVRLIEKNAPEGEVPYKLYNIGNHSPEPLSALVESLEEALSIKAKTELYPMQPGDVYATYADVSDLQKDVGFAPDTPLKEGIGQFVAWYREYYG